MWDDVSLNPISLYEALDMSKPSIPDNILTRFSCVKPVCSDDLFKPPAVPSSSHPRPLLHSRCSDFTDIFCPLKHNKELEWVEVKCWGWGNPLFIRQQIEGQQLYDVEGHCWLINGHMSAGRCCVNTSSQRSTIHQPGVNEGWSINRWVAEKAS